MANNEEAKAKAEAEAKAKAEAEAKAKAEAEAKAKAEAEAKAKAKAEAEAKAEEYEEIFIPKTSKDDDAQFISVNGKRILVKKGMPVKVPKAHAEVWKNSQKQTAKNDEYIAENSSN
jgi:hypothetical protein